MYVCMYCVHVCMYVCMYVCIYVPCYVFTYLCMCLCIYDTYWPTWRTKTNLATYKERCRKSSVVTVLILGRLAETWRLTEQKRATKNGEIRNHISEYHRVTKHKIDWDSAECVTYSTNYQQRLTLEIWYTNSEQEPLNQQLHLTNGQFGPESTSRFPAVGLRIGILILGNKRVSQSCAERMRAAPKWGLAHLENHTLL